MNNVQRLRSLFAGIFVILLGLILIFIPEDGLTIVTAILSLSLTIRGFSYLHYYFTMARHMVGGKAILYVGIIFLDLGAFTGTLADEQKIFIAIYLAAVHLFSGAIDIMRAFESKKLESSWRVSFATGIGNIVIAVVCAVFIRTPDILVYVYSVGLLYSGALRIAGAFRKTAIVYIQ